MSKLTESEARRRVTERFIALRKTKQFVQGQDINKVFSTQEKTLWLLESVDAVIGNGPFEEFFTRPVSVYLNEIVDAFLRIGADQCAAEFSKAIAIFAPDRVFEHDADFTEIGRARERRWENLSEEECNQLDACFSRFMKCSKFEELVTKLEIYLESSIPEENP